MRKFVIAGLVAVAAMSGLLVCPCMDMYTA